MLVVHINMNNTTNIILYPVFSLSDTLCKSILRNDGKITTKLWLAMGPFQIMLIFFFSWIRNFDNHIYKNNIN